MTKTIGNTLAAATLLVGGWGLAVAADQHAPPDQAIQRDIQQSHWPKRYFPAEEVLNGDIEKKYPESPIYPKEIKWRTEGVAFDRLSKVPPPGVHPRVVLSPSDIDNFRAMLLMGDDAPPEFRAAMASLKKSNMPEQMALRALILEDESLGRQAVEAGMVLMRKNLHDFQQQVLAGGQAEDNAYHTGGNVKSGTYNIALFYDYAFNFMTPEEQKEARGILVQLTANRYISPMELPRHYLINNHLAFATMWFCGPWAIEGEEGADPRLPKLATENMEAFVTSLFSPNGIAYEEKKPQLNPYAYIGAARRNPKLMGHPHLSEYARYVANSAYWRYEDNARRSFPEGKWVLGRIGITGGFDNEAQIFPSEMMRFFYPHDPVVEMAWAIQGGTPHAQEDLALLFSTASMHREDKADKITEMPVLPKESTDKIGLSFYDPMRGWFRTRSDWSRESTVLNFKNKSDLWSAGHEISEHNTWELTSHGVQWSPHDNGSYLSAHQRNMVLIDGQGPPRWQPVPGIPLGHWESDEASAAAFDATDGYNWQKFEKLFERWHPMLFSEGESWLAKAGFNMTRNFEQPFFPGIKKYQEGFSHLNIGNWHGESRGNERVALWDEVQQVIRTMHLARGKHPYVLSIDDVRKDDAVHHYQWLMRLHADLELESQKDNDLVFKLRKNPDPRRQLKPRDGFDPYNARLLVRVLHRNTQSQELEPYITKDWHRLVVPASGVEPEFRILLYPFWEGESLPATTWSADRKQLDVVFPDQHDTYTFTKGEKGRTLYTMTRDGKEVLAVGGKPGMPKLRDRELYHGPDYAGIGGNRRAVPRDLQDNTIQFHDAASLVLAAPRRNEVIRYTTDGSTPTTSSPVYNAEIPVSVDTVIKAVTHRTSDQVGDEQVSDVATFTFVKRPLAPPLPSGGSRPGLVVEVFEDFKTAYNDDDGFFTGDKPMLADGSDRVPLLRTTTDSLSLPLVHPLARQVLQSRGIYKFTGTINVPLTGKYLFKLRSMGPVSLRIGGRQVIEAKGPYHLSQRDRIGQALLAAGPQSFELVVNDRFFWKGRFRNIEKDYGHFGDVALSTIVEPEPELSLGMVLPGHSAYVPVGDTLFACSPAADIQGQGIQPAPAAFTLAAPEGAEVRHTLAKVASPFDPVVSSPVDTSLTAHGEAVVDLDVPVAPVPTADSPSGTSITIKEPGSYVIRAAAFKDGKQIGQVMDKRVQVLERMAPVKAKVEPGLVLTKYEQAPYLERLERLPNQPETYSPEQHEAFKDYIRNYYIDWPADFLDAKDSKVTLTDRVPSLDDNLFRRSIRTAGKRQTTEVFEYTGYFNAPASGIYTFDVDRNGQNRLLIHDRLVANNREKGSWPSQAVWLEQGLHPINYRIFMSEGAIKVKYPGYDEFADLKNNNLFRDTKK